MSKIRDIFSARRAKRPPVHLTYPAREPDSGDEIEITFVIGVLADLFSDSLLILKSEIGDKCR
jgi:predicted component of type VI protein secretion system